MGRMKQRDVTTLNPYARRGTDRWRRPTALGRGLRRTCTAARPGDCAASEIIFKLYLFAILRKELISADCPAISIDIMAFVLFEIFVFVVTLCDVVGGPVVIMF